MTSETTEVARFYQGGPDHRGRRLVEILAWDNNQLEFVHDYIQFLFPLPEPSAFNLHAPLLVPRDAAFFITDPVLHDRLLVSFARMLAFYGFRLVPHGVEPTPAFKARAAIWLTPGNHNHLRITRILRCLALLGCGVHARAFLAALDTVAKAEGQGKISPVTLRYWRQAAASTWAP